MVAKFEAFATQKNIQLIRTEGKPNLSNSINANETNDENPALKTTIAKHKRAKFLTIGF